MSKKQFKSQASSSRAAFGTGAGTGFGGFGSSTSGSTLSYLDTPADFSSISDSNVVVAFKNLLKKDSTTKAKGLEDLRTYVQAHPYEQGGGVEQAILDVWVKLYPRISIDNSRRVRELSHTLQYELLKSARKRMEKHIPSIVGAWLAGTYDRDRPVAKVASDGVASFLDTEQKMLLFWRRCQTQILEFAQGAIKETPQSLSDERSVSKDDAQAKYDRVIGASLSLVVNLLAKLKKTDIEKCKDEYERFFLENGDLWKFISSKDSFVRRTTAQLLLVSLEQCPGLVENGLETLSTAFIAEGLKVSQLGSSLVFLQALDKLTSIFPELWTTSYKGKKSASARLESFIAKGSQGGPAEYWQVLASLLLNLPPGILPTDHTDALELLKALREGIASRGEPRANIAAAWDCYFSIIKHYYAYLANKAEWIQLLSGAVFPVFEQYLRPAAENSRWSMPNSTPALAKAFELCTLSDQDESKALFKAEWQRLTDLLVTGILTSLPEKSKDFEKSQVAIVAEAHRYFALQAEIIKKHPVKGTDTSYPVKMLVDACSSIITRSLEVLVSRNGKPFSAAGTVEAALRIIPSLISATSNTQGAIASFLNEELPKLVISPSSSYLIASLNAFRSLPNQNKKAEQIWSSAIEGALSVPNNDSKKPDVVKALISSHSVSALANEETTLQEYLFDAAATALEGQLDFWPLIETAIMFDIFNEDMLARVLNLVVDAIGDEELSHHALRALEFIAQHRLDLLLRDEDSTHITIMTKLLALSESANPSRKQQLGALREMIIAGSDQKDGSDSKKFPILTIIQESLETAGPQSLSIGTLVHQAETLIKSPNFDSNIDILPNCNYWSNSLAVYFTSLVDPALAMTNILGGAAWLAEPISDEAPTRHLRDLNGYSIAFRMALYMSKVVTIENIFESLPTDKQVNILSLLCQILELTNDQFGLQTENGLWESLTDPDVENEVQDFISSTQNFLGSILTEAEAWRDGSAGGYSDVAYRLVSQLIESSKGRSTSAFYAGRALANILSQMVESHGWHNAGGDEWLASLNVLKASTTETFPAVAVLAGLKESLGSSKLVNNLCNRLVSDVAGATTKSEKTLPLIVLLNATLAVYDQGNLPVAHNRLIFAVKQITSWLVQPEGLDSPVAAEACRSLQLLFPAIKDVYGTYWESALSFCVGGWSSLDISRPSKDQLPVIHSGLKLLALLKSLEDANDDLEEALLAFEEPLANALVHLLLLQRMKENQPWRIVDDLIFRQISKIPLNYLKDLSDIYSLMASEFPLIQEAAFWILHCAIPVAQAEISVNVVLEKTDARLPDELLSLLLGAPSIENYPDDVLAQYPSAIRGYLLSWHLVYDTFTNASFKVRNDYVEHLKSENCVGPLLDFLFDVLGHSAGHPINLDKARVTAEMITYYDMKAGDAEPDEYNMQWLLIHLYYLCLKHTPNLAKTWWIDCKSKQTRIAVESWTEKYYSPLIISETLEDVSKWAGEQEAPAEDEKELQVKVSKKSREVYAGYEVDEMMSQIMIRLPPTYPLEGVKVEGVNRVAATEKKWKSWIMITQGIITFSNGSIADGLLAFRKNIVGALKGKDECSICYSIISSDKKMPDKTCGTCKHLFHSSCLFKWFATSNQSTCPLCRNPFHYAVLGRNRRGEVDAAR